MDSTLELQTLKLFLTKEHYVKHRKGIPPRVFTSNAKDIYEVIAYLHKRDKEAITTSELFSAYKLNGSPTQARLEVMRVIINNLEDIDTPDLAILKMARDKELASQIADRAIQVVNSKLDDASLKDLMSFVQELEDYQEVEDDYCSTDIEVLKGKVQHSEFKFGIEFIDAVVSSPGRGQFMVVFASTNAGKSTLVSHLNVGYLEQGYKVLYLANEEPDYKIMYNHIRSAENKTEEEIRQTSSVDTWDRLKDNFKLVAAHNYTMLDIDLKLKEVRPDILVIDQLDNIKYSGNAPRHEQLEHMYQGARALASKYDCLSIAVSQANNDASGKLVLNTHMMANSRIGKAGAADLILGIGMRDMADPKRCITICKNKINGVHKEIYCKIDAMHARYLP